ncbi:hypothetical protein ACM2VK_26190, partial [Escherichia coli]|nr:hypothetical protein [Escherichia coli]
GQQCPYVRPERREIQLIKRLQQFVPDALPVVRKASWQCRQCHHVDWPPESPDNQYHLNK